MLEYSNCLQSFMASASPKPPKREVPYKWKEVLPELFDDSPPLFDLRPFMRICLFMIWCNAPDFKYVSIERILVLTINKHAEKYGFVISPEMRAVMETVEPTTDEMILLSEKVIFYVAHTLVWTDCSIFMLSVNREIEDQLKAKDALKKANWAVRGTARF